MKTVGLSLMILDLNPDLVYLEAMKTYEAKSTSLDLPNLVLNMYMFQLDCNIFCTDGLEAGRLATNYNA